MWGGEGTPSDTANNTFINSLGSIGTGTDCTFIGSANSVSDTNPTGIIIVGSQLAITDAGDNSYHLGHNIEGDEYYLIQAQNAASPSGRSFTINAPVTLPYALTVAGAIDANGALDVDGITSLDAVTVSETLVVTGVTTLSGGSILTGDVNIGDLAVADNATFGENVSIAGWLDVTGELDSDNASVYGSLYVEDDAEFEAGATVGTTLVVTGATTLSDDLNVTGDYTSLLGKVSADKLNIGGDGFVVSSLGFLQSNHGAIFNGDVDLSDHSLTGLTDALMVVDSDAVNVATLIADRTSLSAAPDSFQTMTFKNGIVMKFGSQAMTSTTGAVAFVNAFQGAIISVQVTIHAPSKREVAITTSSLSGFEIDTDVYVSGQTFSWFVIGS
jgi:cytoskeletal protein CcmA (bactofilin family)